MGKPAFDPNKPFESDQSKPKFDPNRSFEKGAISQPPDKLQMIKDYAAKLGNATVDQLPILGMATGGMVGSIPGAFVGGVTGTGLQKAIKGYQSQGMDYFTNPPTQQGTANEARDLIAGGISGVGGEGLGQSIGGAVNMAKPYIKSGVSKGAEFLTGVPKEAYSRLIDYPSEVLKAYGPKEALDIGRKAQGELDITNAIQKNDIQGARRIFAEKFGNNQVDTAPIINSRISKNAASLPNAEGVGAMTPDEARQLSTLERKGLTTKSVTYPELNQSNVVDQTPIMGERIGQTQINGPEFKGFESHPVQGPQELMPQVSKENIYSKPYNPLKEAPKTKPIPDKQIAQWSPDKMLRPETSIQEPIAYSQQLSNKSARELQQFADQLDNEITTFDNNKMPGSGDTRYQASLRQLYGTVKNQLHKIDPEGLGAADAKYSDYANKVSSMGKLANDNQMESFINNYYGKNKELMRQGSKDVFPESIPDLENMAASRAFTQQGPSGSELGRRAQIASSSMVGGVGLGIGSHSPGMAMAGLGLGAAVNPTVNKQVIGRASQLAQSLQNNPELLNFMKSYTGQQAVSPWLGALLKQQGE